MATAPVKSQPLHNFNFAFLKWGTQCGDSSSNSTAYRHRSLESDSDHDRLRSTRVGSRSTRIHCSSLKPIKLSHREEQQQQKQLENSSLKPIKLSHREEQQQQEEDVVEDGETGQRPWNLRPRKVVAETTMAMADVVIEKENETAALKSMILRGLAENGGVTGKNEKMKLWIALSKEEIEEDNFVITGSRPSRRPKKRAKNIQKQLDNTFPGLWLVGTTADAYRIAYAPVKK